MQKASNSKIETTKCKHVNVVWANGEYMLKPFGGMRREGSCPLCKQLIAWDRGKDASDPSKSFNFQEATEVAHKAAVSLQEAQTMLAELDLKCHSDGCDAVGGFQIPSWW